MDVQTEQAGRKLRKPQAETKTEQGPFGVLGKCESEGTPHQATDTRTPPVLVLQERELEEEVGRKERWKLGELERDFLTRLSNIT